MLYEVITKHLDRDGSTQASIPGRVHRPHPAHANLGGEFVRAEPTAGLQGHELAEL